MNNGGFLSTQVVYENQLANLSKQIDEKDKEIERLNNIINELEKWLNEEYDATIFDYQNAIEDVIDKLIKLKGSGVNE